MRQTNSSAALATVVYRSRAVRPPSDADLEGLVQAAQARNRREAITGILLYDENCFFQWLEGPAEGVARVMRSIQRDPRHAELEILRDGPARTRRFADWDMRLAVRGSVPGLLAGDVLEPGASLVTDLRQDSRRAVRSLLGLVGAAVASPPPLALPERSASRRAMARTIETVLRSTFRRAIVSKLPDPGYVEELRWEPNLSAARVSELAELLISTDEDGSLQLIRELRGNRAPHEVLYAPLFEPAARRLGDLWTEDFCADSDVTLGLARLGAAVRLLGIDAPRARPRDIPRSVLVVPAPGEAHRLVATLDVEWLSGRGWDPQYEFPEDDRDLQDLVSSAWVDVLDLSLSAAFRRSDRLPSLRRTISLARRASRNTGLLVIVGGRTFAENASEGWEVDADLASLTSQGLDQRLLAAAVVRTQSPGRAPRAGRMRPGEARYAAS